MKIQHEMREDYWLISNNPTRSISHTCESFSPSGFPKGFPKTSNLFSHLWWINIIKNRQNNETEALSSILLLLLPWRSWPSKPVCLSWAYQKRLYRLQWCLNHGSSKTHHSSPWREMKKPLFAIDKSGRKFVEMKYKSSQVNFKK